MKGTGFLRCNRALRQPALAVVQTSMKGTGFLRCNRQHDVRRRLVAFTSMKGTGFLRCNVSFYDKGTASCLSFRSCDL